MVEVQRGFSLIEIMVTVAVAGILAMYGGSFTANWLAKQKLEAAEETLQQAYARARSLALRNGSSSASGNSSSYLVLVNNQICVVEGTSAAEDCSAPVWLGDLPVDSSSINSSATACIAFSSAGLPTTGTLDGETCTETTAYALTKGSNDASGYLE